MSIRGVHRGVTAQDTEDGHVQGLYGLAEHPLVERRAHAVQDHTPDPQVRVEGRVAVHDGRGRAGHRRGVYNEQDRSFEKLRDMGGRGVLPGAALAVEETHDALHDGDVGAACAVGEERGYKLGTGEEGIEVATRATGSEGVVGGVYKVRSDLERGDAETFAGKRGHEAGGDGRFARARVGSGNYEAWQRSSYHSMPFCPR